MENLAEGRAPAAADADLSDLSEAELDAFYAAQPAAASGSQAGGVPEPVRPASRRSAHASVQVARIHFTTQNSTWGPL